MYQIHSFYFDSKNQPRPIDNILGDECLVYSFNVQACPGTKIQIGANENSFILIGSSGGLKIECEKYPIEIIKIKESLNLDFYPIIIDIVYKGVINIDG